MIFVLCIPEDEQEKVLFINYLFTIKYNKKLELTGLISTNDHINLKKTLLATSLYYINLFFAMVFVKDILLLVFEIIKKIYLVKNIKLNV